MTKKVTTEQVLKYMNIKYGTLNRLMREHPNPEVGGSGSTWRGKTFPSAEKVGRDLFFDIKEVRAWCDENSEFYRRKKPTQSKITLPIDSYLAFLGRYQPSPHGTQKFDEELNEIPIEQRDQVLLFNKAEIVGDEVALEFDDIEDAIWFKLKHA
jgi:hypothetical protein